MTAPEAPLVETIDALVRAASASQPVDRRIHERDAIRIWRGWWAQRAVENDRVGRRVVDLRHLGMLVSIKDDDATFENQHSPAGVTIVHLPSRTLEQIVAVLDMCRKFDASKMAADS